MFHPPKALQNNPVHYPSDRRFRVWVRAGVLFPLLALVLLPIVAAWAQYLINGLPPIAPNLSSLPQGFPAWIRLAHYANLVFIVMLMRSGLSIPVSYTHLRAHETGR